MVFPVTMALGRVLGLWSSSVAEIVLGLVFEELDMLGAAFAFVQLYSSSALVLVALRMLALFFAHVAGASMAAPVHQACCMACALACVACFLRALFYPPKSWAYTISRLVSDLHVKHWAVPKDDAVITAFHGTTTYNAKSIVAEGFSLSKSQFGMLGVGVYFSRDPTKCLAYGGSDGQILQLRVKLGTVCMVRRKEGARMHTSLGKVSKHEWFKRCDVLWVPSMSGLVASELEEACIAEVDRIEVVCVWSKRYVAHLLVANCLHHAVQNGRLAPRFVVFMALMTYMLSMLIAAWMCFVLHPVYVLSVVTLAIDLERIDGRR